jgi:hypothetical protein
MTHFLLWLLTSLNDLQLAEVDSCKFGGLLHILMPLLLGLAISSIYLAQPSSEFHTTMCKVLMNPSNQAIYQLDYSLMCTSLTLPATLQILSMAFKIPSLVINLQLRSQEKEGYQREHQDP